MRFNPLLDEPPESVEVNGREYRINTDFRVVLSYFRLFEEKDKDDSEKAFLALRLFFGDEIYREDCQGLIQKIGWFVSRGQEPKKSKKQERVFDMDVDAGRIFAAFFQVYRINLRAGKDGLHWWTFCELLEALPDGTHMSEVVRIRSRKFDKNMSPAERNELQRAKERYRIGEPEDAMSVLFKGLSGVSL